VQYALQQEGYDVTVARSGEEGLEFATQKAPDLVVLDVRLPGMDGFEVLRRLRAAGAKMPVLVLTARDDEVDKVIGLELGADDYLTKPFGLRELMSRIRALLRRSYGDLSDAVGVQVRRGGLAGRVVVEESDRDAQPGEQLFQVGLSEFAEILLADEADDVVQQQHAVDGREALSLIRQPVCVKSVMSRKRGSCRADLHPSGTRSCP
jgi:DNA-binding response OmpR family regulator